MDDPVTVDHVPNLAAAKHDIDEYLVANRVYDTFDFLLKELVTKQPADPLQHMLECLQTAHPTGPLRVFVFGAPGLGKCNLAKKLASTFGVAHISTGALLREAGVDTSFGDLANEDETAKLVIAKVKQVMNRNEGFVLDGFPRTRKEATYLKEEAIVPAHVLLLKASAEYIHEQNRKIMAGELQGDCCKPEILEAKLNLFSGRTSAALEAYQGRLTSITAEGHEEDILGEMARIARKLPVSSAPVPPPRVVLVGPRGAGSTEQAVRLALRLGAVLVDAGDLKIARFDFNYEKDPAKRHHKRGTLRKQRTTIGLPNVEALEAADPLGIVGVRLRQPDCTAQGFVLTRFPNTAEEALALDQDTWLHPTRIIHLEASEETCVARLSCLKTDPVTEQVWTTEPENERVRKRLIADENNTPEAVLEAHSSFKNNLPGILEAFKNDGRCLRLSAEGMLPQVFKELADFVDRPLPLPKP